MVRSRWTTFGERDTKICENLPGLWPRFPNSLLSLFQIFINLDSATPPCATLERGIIWTISDRASIHFEPIEKWKIHSVNLAECLQFEIRIFSKELGQIHALLGYLACWFYLHCCLEHLDCFLVLAQTQEGCALFRQC